MYKLFIGAFVQVALVAMNVKFISGGYIIPMLIVAFCISIIWSFNIKKIAFGSNWDKIVYAFGAMCGTGFGYYFATYLTNLIK